MSGSLVRKEKVFSHKLSVKMTRGGARGKHSSKNTPFDHVNKHLNLEKLYSGDDIVCRLSGTVFKVLLQEFRLVLN